MDIPSVSMCGLRGPPLRKGAPCHGIGWRVPTRVREHRPRAEYGAPGDAARRRIRSGPVLEARAMAREWLRVAHAPRDVGIHTLPSTEQSDARVLSQAIAIWVRRLRQRNVGRAAKHLNAPLEVEERCTLPQVCARVAVLAVTVFGEKQPDHRLALRVHVPVVAL